MRARFVFGGIVIRARILFFIWLVVGTACSTLSEAADFQWRNDLTFYGDNTEFFEPFRTRETILGQQGKSFLETALGAHDFIYTGVFADFRSMEDPTVTVNPILSFEYRNGGTTLVMGTLETHDRHGYLEPLEVTTLEFTRPIEYGIQWLQGDAAYQADVFLNWQLLNTPGVPETMDYGGVMKEELDGHLTLEQQMHGFHEGGKLFYVTLYNNWVPALGFEWKTGAGSLGQIGLAAYGIASATLTGDYLPDTAWGGGAYVRPFVNPGDGWEFFGIGWWGRDFYSNEGDSNYNSTGPTGFYRANRTYEELCAHKSFPMEGDASFVAELRSHWIDEWWAYSFRLAVYAPLDFPLGTVGAQVKKDDQSSKP